MGTVDVAEVRNSREGSGDQRSVLSDSSDAPVSEQYRL